MGENDFSFYPVIWHPIMRVTIYYIETNNINKII